MPAVRRVLYRQYGYSNGTYRGPYVHRTVILNQSLPSRIREVGKGSITISGRSVDRLPTIPVGKASVTVVGRATTAVDTGSIEVGRGLVKVLGRTITAPSILQENFAVLRKFVKRYPYGGVHRGYITRTVYRLQVYPKVNVLEVPVGKGIVTILGRRPSLDPRVGKGSLVVVGRQLFPVGDAQATAVAGKGSITVRGLVPLVFNPGLLRAIIRASNQRRFYVSKYSETYPLPEFNAEITVTIKPLDEGFASLNKGTITIVGRAIGFYERIKPIGKGSLTVLGRQPDKLVNYPVGKGALTVVGRQPGIFDENLVTNRSLGKGTLTVVGRQPTITEEITVFFIPVGKTTLVINGKLTTSLGDGAANVSVDKSTVVINGRQIVSAVGLIPTVGISTLTVLGRQITSSFLIEVGKAAISVAGKQVSVTNNTEIGVATITINGRQLVPNAVNTNTLVGRGIITISSKTLVVSAAGAWKQKGRGSGSWTKEDRSGGDWNRKDKSSTTWEKS